MANAEQITFRVRDELGIIMIAFQWLANGRWLINVDKYASLLRDDRDYQTDITNKALVIQTRLSTGFAARFCLVRRAGVSVSNSRANSSATQSTNARMRADR